MIVNWLGTEEDTDFFRISDEISQLCKLNTRGKFTFYPAAKAEGCLHTEQVLLKILYMVMVIEFVLIV